MVFTYTQRGPFPGPAGSGFIVCPFVIFRTNDKGISAMATSELTVVCLSAIGAACGCYLKLSSPEECTCVYSYILAKS